MLVKGAFMLSAASRPYIEASVPVLREHGLAITKVFYSNLFASHPQLHNIFNAGNQANGTQQQSLASAVFAYAANIDNAGALAPVISRIVNKHVSLGVTAAHYPIVGEHLLGADGVLLGADLAVLVGVHAPEFGGGGCGRGAGEGGGWQDGQGGDDGKQDTHINLLVSR
jgi:nitric oxide dioxygenase